MNAHYTAKHQKQNKRQSTAGSFLAAHKRQRAWRRVVTMLAAVVVFCTTYALILPAVTSEYICGKEDHTHTDACYQQITTVAVRTCTCGMDAGEGHSHTDACYTTHRHGEGCYTSVRGELTCLLPEGDGHIHAPECFDESGALICGLVDGEGHKHTDECYNLISTLTCDQSTEPVLSCGKDVSEGHSHTDACYTYIETPVDPSTLTCTNTDPNHTHSTRCYGAWQLICPHEEHTHTAACLASADDSDKDDATAPTICGMEEHTHGEDCYDAAGVLTCTIAVHTHDDTCRPQPEIPVYCGKEAHTHDALLCYDATGALTCTLEEHTHDDTCYIEQAKTLYCGKEAHTHDALLCYDATGALTCTLEEHTHDDSCYIEQEEEALCGLAEHTHDALCYDAAGTLVCQLEEHTHGKGCYMTAEELAAIKAQYEQEIAELETRYQAYMLDGRNLDEVEDLIDRMDTSLDEHELTQADYDALYARVEVVLMYILNTVAEPCYGTNWMSIGFESYYEQSTTYAADIPMLSAVYTQSAAGASDKQVVGRGGEKSDTDGDVAISKTIAGTDIENVFDITLTVQTPQEIKELVEEPDMAVVIVMDISNTMRDDFPKNSGNTRYSAAQEAAYEFLKTFVNSNSLGVSKVGFVAFNSNAHMVYDLTPCTTIEKANALNQASHNYIDPILREESYNGAKNRFTNIEAGLKMANDMLEKATNKNKYIIFLSDGFPTTYISSGYNGYDTYNTSVFYDRVLDMPCSYGTSYSDEAAIRASTMAASIKASGKTIYSIGIGIGGQSVNTYIKQSEERKQEYAPTHWKYYSVVDRYKDKAIEIGTDEGGYANWLKNSIGSGYYQDTSNFDQLKNAFDDIFGKIKTTIETASKADWVAADPIPYLQSLPDTVEYIGMFDKTGKLNTGNTLTGEHKPAAENSAVFDGTKYEITWDLKKSGYSSVTDGSKTIYTYSLKYRVRLRNEAGNFAENTVYDTNARAYLTYRVTKNVNGELTVSDPKTLDFPIPSVKGYLGELTFTKQDNNKKAVKGAEFTLTHDVNTCTVCRGDGTSVTTVNSVTATSDENGKVAFANIPSGHVYTLEETKIPDGYTSLQHTYVVTIAYDKVSVQEKNSKGELVDWNGTVINEVQYQLPETGGVGAALYIVVGAGLVGASVVGCGVKKRRLGRRNKL